MQDVDSFGVRILSDGLPYADGAEEEILSYLLEVVDRSVGSDELATRIHDWPTMYHFSPMRPNALRPLRVQPGMQVLEVGCGSGAITRWLAEGGARVVAVDANVKRARAAAVRCQGLEGVEVLAGTLDDVSPEPRFDVVLAVGVLEYAPLFLGGDDAPNRFLEGLRRRLAPNGALVLAIENQFGLKYLLGYQEDHLGLPWVGVEDYTRTSGPRTWSRKALHEMLASVGLSGQRWLFPFPDYKLASVVIDEALYERPEGPEIIDQLVRVPVTAYAGQPSTVCDTRLAHRQLLKAGLGPDVANSFVVVAAAERGHADAFLGPEMAWLLSEGRRRRQWRRQRVVLASERGLYVEDRTPPGRARRLGWLAQAEEEPGGMRPLVRGEPLDLLVIEAIRKNDLAAVSKLLGMWRAEMERQAHSDPESVRHPFRPIDDSPALPEDFLDVVPANFILADGSLTFIDREWISPGPVSATLVEARALWYLARETVESGEVHPWGSMATIDEVCQALCALAGIECTTETLASVRAAEAELQHLVLGEKVDSLAEDLMRVGVRRTVDVSPRRLPFTALRAALEATRCEVEGFAEKVADLNAQLSAAAERERLFAELRGVHQALQEDRADLEGRLAEREIVLNEAHAEVERLRGQLRQVEANAAEFQRQAAQRESEVTAWRNRMAAIDRRLLMRVYRKARPLIGRR